MGCSVAEQAWSSGRATQRTLRGFTLIELLVVLVIAAVAVGVVGVSAQAYLDRARYHQTVLDLATQLGRARGLSQQEGKPVVVSYLPQTRQLAIDGQAVLDIAPALEFTYTPMPAASADRAAVGEPIFSFNADGRARGGQLALAGGARVVLFRINWLLGTVQLAEAASP